MYQSLGNVGNKQNKYTEKNAFGLYKYNHLNNYYFEQRDTTIAFQTEHVTEEGPIDNPTIKRRQLETTRRSLRVELAHNPAAV